MGAISTNVREAAVAAYLAGKGTIAAIAAEFGIGKATLHRYLRTARANSALEPKPRAGGAQRRLGKEDEQVLVAFLASHRRASLEEMRVYMAQETGKQVSRMALHRTLRRLGIQCVRKPLKAVIGVETTPRRYGYSPQHRRGNLDLRYPSSTTDAEWEFVRDLFDRHDGAGRRPIHEPREMFDAICYVVRSGCAWRMLPRDFPKWQAVYATFRAWASQGRFEAMHDRMRSLWRRHAGRDPNPTAAVVDSQSVKTAERGGTFGYDAGKKIKGRKRHIVTDTGGLLLVVHVHAADVQDRDGGIDVMLDALDKYPSIKKFFVDSAYAGRCADTIQKRTGAEFEISRRPETHGVWQGPQLPPFTPKRGFQSLPKRWIVERTHAWNDRPRRMAKDFDQRLDVSEAWIWLVQGVLLLRRVAQSVDQKGRANAA